MFIKIARKEGHNPKEEICGEPQSISFNTKTMQSVEKKGDDIIVHFSNGTFCLRNYFEDYEVEYNDKYDGEGKLKTSLQNMGFMK